MRALGTVALSVYAELRIRYLDPAETFSGTASLVPDKERYLLLLDQ